jgi:hypothetical protein
MTTFQIVMFIPIAFGFGMMAGAAGKDKSDIHTWQFILGLAIMIICFAFVAGRLTA